MILYKYFEMFYHLIYLSWETFNIHYLLDRHSVYYEYDINLSTVLQ